MAHCMLCMWKMYHSSHYQLAVDIIFSLVHPVLITGTITLKLQGPSTWKVLQFQTHLTNSSLTY